MNNNAAKNLSNKVAPSYLGRKRVASAERGDMLVNIGVALLIMGLLAIYAVPAVQNYIVEGKVPTVAAEIQRFVARTRITAAGSGPTPYAGINTADNLIRAVDGGSLTVNGAAVAHGLGGTGTGANGTIALAPANIGGAGAGSGFQLTFTNVSMAACPLLATTLQKVSDQITINGTAVKTLGAANEVGAYNSAAAEANCVDGEANTFVFTSR